MAQKHSWAKECRCCISILSPSEESHSHQPEVTQADWCIGRAWRISQTSRLVYLYERLEEPEGVNVIEASELVRQHGNMVSRICWLQILKLVFSHFP